MGGSVTCYLYQHPAGTGARLVDMPKQNLGVKHLLARHGF